MNPNHYALVIDIGSSSVRCGGVDEYGHLHALRSRSVLPQTPSPGLVEIDPQAIIEAVTSLSAAVIEELGAAGCVGIANQRASTVVWDARDGKAIGPGIGWQDLRTVGTCLELQAKGIRLAPNASATKIAWLIEHADAERYPLEHLRCGTLDSWVIWHLTKGASHITDLTNAGVTSLIDLTTCDWDYPTIEALTLPRSLFATIVDSMGHLARATALSGSPPITGILGDQQASLLGQSCVYRGDAKLTIGTGAMLDLVTGPDAPAEAKRNEYGTFPIPTWQLASSPTWGLEAIALSAGSCIEWLRDDLGMIASAEESEAVAASVESADGVCFVPALLGLGTPIWDFGARGLLSGLTRGSGRGQIARAVLEGIAQRARDLVDAAEQDSGLSIKRVRVDGGMTSNTLFLSLLADALERPLEVSPVLEATVLGAGYAAGLGIGMFTDLDHIARLWRPRVTLEPTMDPFFRGLAREAYLEARRRSERTIPGLSAIDF